MISIATPAYNRAHTLPRLFESLERQAFRDFEWIVVDDGSTDGTKELCDSFAEKASFPFRYLKQENSGKHVAINVAAQEARGEWFFIVDSDDYLTDTSLEVNARYLTQIEEDSAFAGVSGVRMREDGSFLVGTHGETMDDLPRKIQVRFSLEYIDATPQDFRIKYSMPGDRAEVVRTDLVRRFPFPSFQGERFVSEYYLWQSISDLGLKVRWFNGPTYIADYLTDGLTRNMREVTRSSPLGKSYVDNFTLSSGAPLSEKLRSAVNYTRYGRLGGKGIAELAREVNSMPLFVLGLPLALLTPIKRSGLQ